MTYRKAALTGPQLPLASRPRTNTVWRPKPRPPVLMTAWTSSILLSNAPSLGIMACATGTGLVDQGGTSI